ncbi:hypothetical protein EJB05_29242 [Eragrostis curvula]|uniref:Uncharacterized protein n=1 Tax=Eragrostis curvula TaxID=38414 RepID=A0A5J9USU5_9POAL|nr:hypothetical protein EJB05_29242 [Eragrostis curvula]
MVKHCHIEYRRGKLMAMGAYQRTSAPVTENLSALLSFTGNIMGEVRAVNCMRGELSLLHELEEGIQGGVQSVALQSETE